MRVKTVSITYERKLNLGNYNSATLGVTLWADLDNGESADDAVTKLQQEARDLVKDEYHRLQPKTSGALVPSTDREGNGTS